MKPFKTFTAVVSLSFGLAALGLAPAVAQTAAPAQTTAPAYTPTVGQQGKDVVWVPTAQGLVDRMLDMAKVTPSDYLVDLGSGDGRTVITAAKRGLRAHGIEYNPDLVAISKSAAEREGVADKATFVQGDIFESDFSNATVVTLFLLPQLNLRLRPTLLQMKPGTRVVSNSFDMDDWEPDERVQAEGECSSFCRAFLWIVPAKVDGTWSIPQGQMALRQTFQMVSGTMTREGKTLDVTGRVTGDKITLTAGDQTFTGTVNGGTIEGTAGPSGAWTATRS